MHESMRAHARTRHAHAQVVWDALFALFAFGGPCALFALFGIARAQVVWDALFAFGVERAASPQPSSAEGGAASASAYLDPGAPLLPPLALVDHLAVAMVMCVHACPTTTYDTRGVHRAACLPPTVSCHRAR